MLVDGIVNEQNANFAGKDGFFWWVGEVEDHEDPLELGRVKARILNYYTNPNGESAQKLPTENLPWATVLQGTDQAGNDGQGESSGQLQPGAIVMGFFMDGEVAQMPVVMGVLRMEKNQTGTENEYTMTGEKIPKGLGANASNLPPGEANTTSGKKAPGGTGNNSVPISGGTTTKASSNSNAPKNVGNANGVAGSSTNTQKPTTPSKPIPAAQGTGGPWKMLEQSLTYLVEDLIASATNLVSGGGEGNFIDVVNGKVVSAKELLAKVKNFLSAVFAQVVSAMRQALSDLLEPLESAAAAITAQLGLPGGTMAVIQGLITSVLSLICDLDSNIISFINAPIATITNILEGIVSGALSKAEAAVRGVDAMIEGIICGVDGLLSTIQGVLSAIQGIISGVGQATQLLDTFKEGKKVFDAAQNIVKNGFDFTNLLSLLTLLFDLLGSFLSCDREATGGEDNIGWYPFFGTTGCTPAALAATPAGSEYGSCGSGGGAGGFFESFFAEADPYITAAKSFVNGAFQQQLGTPGRQATITKDASGRTKMSIKANNQALAEHKARKEIRTQNPNLTEAQVEQQVQSYVQTQTSTGSGTATDKADQGNFVADHESFPGNYTSEVHGDDCKLVDGDLCRTINGDYRLKITGDCHIEVGGGYFLNAQGAPKQVDNKGEDKSKKDKVQKHTMTFGSDLDIMVTGANMKVNAIEVELGCRELKSAGSTWSDAFKSKTFSGGDFFINTGNLTCNNVTQVHNVGTLSPSPLASVTYAVGGPFTVVCTPGTVPTPPITFTTPGPFLVTCAAGGCTFTVGAGAFVAAVAAGAISLSAGAAVSIKAAAAVSIAAAAACDIKAAIINLN
jgi:hypothetical protein